MISLKFRMLVVAAFVFSGLSFASADDIYVKAKKGKIKKKPRGSSSTLSKVKFGVKLSNAKKQKKWYKVAYRGKKGYIYKGYISKKAPEKDPSLTTEGTNLSSEDIDASSATRGVSPTAMKYASRNSIKKIHRTYIDYHQSFVVSDRIITELPENKQRVTNEDIEKFMEDVKLGPYSD
jgi:uncharacterized protein YgiM (DUF1202 family)